MTNIICLYNNNDIYNKVILKNKNLSGCNIISYDNSKNDTNITKFYNKIIEENILTTTNDDWYVFIHQDFGFMENLELFCENLDKNAIYGATGVAFMPISSKNGKIIKKKAPIGEILQGENDFNFHKYGFPINKELFVEAIDCCCIIINSALIKKHKLLFDENLEFHMYAEELCYRTLHQYRIPTKVKPMKCFHLGKGNLNKDFENSLKYLQNKFQTDIIPSTCPTEYYI